MPSCELPDGWLCSNAWPPSLSRNHPTSHAFPLPPPHPSMLTCSTCGLLSNGALLVPSVRVPLACSDKASHARSHSLHFLCR